MKRKQESGHYEPPHSLFGIIGEVARATGWSVDYILKLDYITLMMIQMDIPRYVEKKKMTPDEIVRHFEEMDKLRRSPLPEKESVRWIFSLITQPSRSIWNLSNWKYS